MSQAQDPREILKKHLLEQRFGDVQKIFLGFEQHGDQPFEFVYKVKVPKQNIEEVLLTIEIVPDGFIIKGADPNFESTKTIEELKEIIDNINNEYNELLIDHFQKMKEQRQAQKREQAAKRQEALFPGFGPGKVQHPLIELSHFKYTVHGKPSLISEEAVQKIKARGMEARGKKFRRIHKRDQKSARELKPGKEPFTDFENELALPFSVVVADNGSLFALYEGKDVEGKSKVLGKGAFGQVKFAQNLDTGEICIVKVQEKKANRKWEDWNEQRKKEAEFAERAEVEIGFLTRQAASKRYDIQIFGGDDLVFQLFPDPGQQNVVYQERAIPWDKEKDFIKSLESRLDIGVKGAQQLRDLHDMRILHRDIKSANTLYDKTTGEFLIIDYGLSAPMDEGGNFRDRFLVGTPLAMAPEIYEGEDAVYSVATDTFAYATILMDLFGYDFDLNGYNKEKGQFDYFTILPNDKMQSAILDELEPYVKEIEESVLQDAKRLIQAMVKMNPNDRQFEGRKVDNPLAIEQELNRIQNKRIAGYKALAEHELKILQDLNVDLSDDRLAFMFGDEHDKVNKILRNYRKENSELNKNVLAMNEILIKMAVKILAQIPVKIRDEVLETQRKELNQYQIKREKILRENVIKANLKFKVEESINIGNFEKQCKEYNDKIKSNKELRFTLGTLKQKPVLSKDVVNFYNFLRAEERKYENLPKKQPILLKRIKDEIGNLFNKFPALKKAKTYGEERKEEREEKEAQDIPSLNKEQKDLLAILIELLVANQAYMKQYESGKKTLRKGGILRVDTELKYANAKDLHEQIFTMIQTPQNLNMKTINHLMTDFEERDIELMGKLPSGDVEKMLTKARKKLDAIRRPPPRPEVF